jgi:hypothetical protein
VQRLDSIGARWTLHVCRARSRLVTPCILHADSKASGVLTVTLGVSLGAMGDTLSGVRMRSSDLVMAAKRNGERNQVHTREGHK